MNTSKMNNSTKSNQINMNMNNIHNNNNVNMNETNIQHINKNINNYQSTYH